ncbi:aminopeptidase ypdf (mp-, ma-, ms-, ap-, np- specific) [hydrocarbon metagenome]|uniref:Aminopeptidase ypdf (Mp-, ma-, ms-, ap-, np-specific) n=1 Tax=hydrocarbon metagenome TaxID=938273 RepID=A0A0W8FN87_9ZZZZ
MRQGNKILLNRISSLQRTFSSCKIDGLIFFDMNNIRYLTGFTGSDGALLINSDKTNLLVDGRYIAQASVETKGLRIMEYRDKIEGISQTIKKNRLKRIGFEANLITLGMYNQLKNSIPEENLVALNGELKFLRAYKDKTEIALMAKAAEISSSSIRSLIDRIKPGCTEKEVALELEVEARRVGADELAFSTIVAAGENAAFPHAKPTDRKIKRGDLVVIDFGVKYKGYCSDETCTIAFGKLTVRQKNAYQMVKSAHDRALAGIKANVPAARIDQCVRSVFGKKYKRFFVHSTGHGVGLEVHEAPRLFSNSTDILKTNMVVTVEPGLYIPGHWGIRIEDTVVVKKNSCEKLTKMDKELIIIE